MCSMRVWILCVLGLTLCATGLVLGDDYDAEGTPREIPIELLIKLNSVETVDEFLSNFVDIKSITNIQSQAEGDSTLIGNRFGDADERKSISIPKPASCIPELQTVSLKTSNDPALFYYPFCTRIERCGGCCSSGLLSCQPKQTEIVNFQVLVTEYTGKTAMKLKNKEIVPVERHLECKCDCIMKASDCNQLQEYHKNECRCACINLDERQKCLAENETKLWDSNNCSCECREARECTTGQYFDQNTCSCLRIPNAYLQKRRRRGQIAGINGAPL